MLNRFDFGMAAFNVPCLTRHPSRHHLHLCLMRVPVPVRGLRRQVCVRWTILTKQLRQDVETMTLVPKASEYTDGLACRGKINVKSSKMFTKRSRLSSQSRHCNAAQERDHHETVGVSRLYLHLHHSAAQPWRRCRVGAAARCRFLLQGNPFGRGAVQR
jgi:hypothetical protein